MDANAGLFEKLKFFHSNNDADNSDAADTEAAGITIPGLFFDEKQTS